MKIKIEAVERALEEQERLAEEEKKNLARQEVVSQEDESMQQIHGRYR